VDEAAAPGIADHGLADIAADGKVDVQPVAAGMPLRDPQVRQSTTRRATEPLEEPAHILAELCRVMAPGPRVCQCAEAVESVRRAVPADLAACSPGRIIATIERGSPVAPLSLGATADRKEPPPSAASGYRRNSQRPMPGSTTRARSELIRNGCGTALDTPTPTRCGVHSASGRKPAALRLPAGQRWCLTSVHHHCGARVIAAPCLICPSSGRTAGFRWPTPIGGWMIRETASWIKDRRRSAAG
jgi:hypothetical protein